MQTSFIVRSARAPAPERLIFERWTQGTIPGSAKICELTEPNRGMDSGGVGMDLATGFIGPQHEISRLFVVPAR
jgi:hypothetical protein